MQLFGMEEHKHHMKLNKDAFFIIIERRRRIISAVWNNERRFVSWLSIKICHPTINPRAGTKHNNPHRHHHSSSDSPSPPAGQPTNHAEIEIGIEILRFEIKNRPRTPPPPLFSPLLVGRKEKRREEKIAKNHAPAAAQEAYLKRLAFNQSLQKIWQGKG